jgi:hypothetical protein
LRKIFETEEGGAPALVGVAFETILRVPSNGQHLRADRIARRNLQTRLAIFAAESEPRRHKPEDLPTQRREQRRSVINKSVLALPAPRRIRDREHVKSVAKQPCLVCGRIPADAQHLRFAQPRALGRKVSDEFTEAA